MKSLLLSSFRSSPAVFCYCFWFKCQTIYIKRILSLPISFAVEQSFFYLSQDISRLIGCDGENCGEKKKTRKNYEKRRERVLFIFIFLFFFGFNSNSQRKNGNFYVINLTFPKQKACYIVAFNSLHLIMPMHSTENKKKSIWNSK